MTMGESTTTGDRAATLRPAGWYTDPEDATRLRRWDGRGWTESWMPHRGGTAAHPRSATVSVPEGWYTDPVDPGVSRWWDGAGWTPRVLVGRVFPGRTRLGTGFVVLGNALAVVLGLHLVLTVLGVAYNAWAWTLFGRWIEDPGSITVDAALRVEALGRVFLVAGGLHTLVTAVLFITWLRRAYGSDRVDPSALRFGAGWTIGAWFVPFLNLVRPYGLVRDLWKGLGARIAGSPGPWVVGAWWGTFIAARFASSVVSALERSAGDEANPTLEQAIATLREIRPLLWWESGAVVLSSVAAVLCIVVVLRVTRAMRAGEGQAPLPVPSA